MTYLLIFLMVFLTACTLVYVDVSSDEEGQTTIEPGGIEVKTEVLGEYTAPSPQPTKPTAPP